MSVLISFSGLPGGKTTVARALAQEISAVYIRADSIEVTLKNSSLQNHPAEDAGYLAAAAVAKDNLVHGLDVFADTADGSAARGGPVDVRDSKSGSARSTGLVPAGVPRSVATRSVP
jgi:hypothetical protein